MTKCEQSLLVCEVPCVSDFTSKTHVIKGPGTFRRPARSYLRGQATSSLRPEKRKSYTKDPDGVANELNGRKRKDCHNWSIYAYGKEEFANTCGTSLCSTQKIRRLHPAVNERRRNQHILQEEMLPKKDDATLYNKEQVISTPHNETRVSYEFHQEAGAGGRKSWAKASISSAVKPVALQQAAAPPKKPVEPTPCSAALPVTLCKASEPGEMEAAQLAPASPPLLDRSSSQHDPMFARGNLVSILRGVSGATLCRLFKSNCNLSLALVKDCRWDTKEEGFMYVLAFSAATGGPSGAAFNGREEEFPEALLEPCPFAVNSSVQISKTGYTVTSRTSPVANGGLVELQVAALSTNHEAEKIWVPYKLVERRVPGKGELWEEMGQITRRELELLTRELRKEDFNESGDARFNEALLAKGDMLSSPSTVEDRRIPRGATSHGHVGNVTCRFEFTELLPMTGENDTVRHDLRVRLQDVHPKDSQLKCLVTTTQQGTGEVFAIDGSGVLTNAHVVHTRSVTKQELVEHLAQLMREGKADEGLAVWELLKHLDTIEEWSQCCAVSECSEFTARNECYPVAISFTLTHGNKELQGLTDTLQVPKEYLLDNESQYLLDVAFFTLQRPTPHGAYPYIPRLRIAANDAAGLLVDVSGLGGAHMGEVRGEIGVAHKGDNYANSIKHSGSTLYGGSGSLLLLSSRHGAVECEEHFKYAFALHCAMGHHIKDGEKRTSPVYNQAIQLGSDPVLSWLQSTLGSRCPTVYHFKEQQSVNRMLTSCILPMDQEQAIWSAFLLDAGRFSNFESAHASSDEDVLDFLITEFDPFRVQALPHTPGNPQRQTSSFETPYALAHNSRVKKSDRWCERYNSPQSQFDSSFRCHFDNERQRRRSRSRSRSKSRYHDRASHSGVYKVSTSQRHYSKRPREPSCERSYYRCDDYRHGTRMHSRSYQYASRHRSPSSHHSSSRNRSPSQSRSRSPVGVRAQKYQNYPLTPPISHDYRRKQAYEYSFKNSSQGACRAFIDVRESLKGLSF